MSKVLLWASRNVRLTEGGHSEEQADSYRKCQRSQINERPKEEVAGLMVKNPEKKGGVKGKVIQKKVEKRHS